MLRPAGYGTYAVGKWHVTKAAPSPTGRKHNWPLQRGFDRYYGTITGAGNFFDPGTLVRDNTMISPLADPEYQPKKYYYTDAISDHAVRVHRRAPRENAADKPLFLYVAYTAAHWPMHALEEDIAKYSGKYDAGYEADPPGPVRKAEEAGADRSRRQQLTPTVGDWDKVADKAWEARCMEVYAAMIDRMDQGIGRIVAELEQTGRLDNTLDLLSCKTTAAAPKRSAASDNDAPAVRARQAARSSRGRPISSTRRVRPKRTRDGYPVRQGPA